LESLGAVWPTVSHCINHIKTNVLVIQQNKVKTYRPWA
jgi:hypothetical protein